ncbi:hypothetical protein C8F04DRAFT_1299201 [Mycena alexandri]|uniref:Uncharacterized protein n=1 Tax=Mycena alexandri TaxID=1745969 RepID=A0AAD6T8D3_9AGAR|nr:hypothetical protein C8F04DRAFT_1299201 [Mycena alexandri]
MQLNMENFDKGTLRSHVKGNRQTTTTREGPLVEQPFRGHVLYVISVSVRLPVRVRLGVRVWVPTAALEVANRRVPRLGSLVFQRIARPAQISPENRCTQFRLCRCIEGAPGLSVIVTGRRTRGGSWDKETVRIVSESVIQTEKNIWVANGLHGSRVTCKPATRPVPASASTGTGQRASTRRRPVAITSAIPWATGSGNPPPLPASHPEPAHPPLLGDPLGPYAHALRDPERQWRTPAAQPRFACARAVVHAHYTSYTIPTAYRACALIEGAAAHPAARGYTRRLFRAGSKARMTCGPFRASSHDPSVRSHVSRTPSAVGRRDTVPAPRVPCGGTADNTYRSISVQSPVARAAAPSVLCRVGAPSFRTIPIVHPCATGPGPTGAETVQPLFFQSKRVLNFNVFFVVATNNVEAI